MRRLLALLTVLLVASPANAELVSYSFTVLRDSITEFDDTLFGNGSTLTDSLRLTLTYDTVFDPDRNGCGGTNCLYFTEHPHSTFVLNVGQNIVAGQTTLGGYGFAVSHQQDAFDLWDGAIGLNGGVVLTGDLAGAPILGHLIISLTDLDAATGLTGVDLPSPFPTVGWDHGFISLGLQPAPGRHFLLTAAIDVASIQSHRVPSPPTIVIVVGAGLVLGATTIARRRFTRPG